MEENIKKIPEEIVKRRAGYVSLSASLEEKFNNQRIRVIESHKDTIKNLALVSGAIATFSLMLLDSEVQKIQLLLVVGTVILLLSALASFLYLLLINEKVGRKVKNNEDLHFQPLDRILIKFEELLEDKVTVEQYLEFEKQMRNVIRETRKNLIKSGRKDEVDRSDEYVGGLFLLGMIFVMMGLILPYIF
jgi:Ca2+/Na+ antiporter